MSITLSGIIFIPLGLAIFLAAPCLLAQLAVIASVFAAAAVLNFDDASFPVGLSPFFFTALLIAFHAVPGWVNGGFRIALAKPLRRHLQMMVAFAGWAVLSAILFPLLFRGMAVDLARKGADTTYYNRLPLHWSLSNGGQAGYLLLDLVVILYLLQRVRVRSDLGAICTAFSWSGLIVVAVGAYQWLAHQAGLPFPVALFNSNAVWAQLANQQIGGIFRISATFNESSGAGAFLAAWVSFEFVLGTGSGPSSWRHRSFALGGVLMVIATTSTTGYVTTAVMLLIILSRHALDPRHHRLNSAPLLAGFTVICAAIVGIFALTSQGSTLLAGVMLDKAGSGSSLHRTATIMRSVDVFAATYGLGAGLGSNRAMSLLAYVASNLGVAGIVLFGSLMVSLLSMSRAVRRTPQRDESVAIWHQALGMAFLARFLALSESGAEITDPIMWLLWGMLLASVRQQFSGFQPIANLSLMPRMAARLSLEPQCANSAPDGTR